MNETHMKRAAEWFLTLKELPINRAHELIQHQQPPTEPPTEKPDKHSPVPAPYDTSLDPSEDSGYAPDGQAEHKTRPNPSTLLAYKAACLPRQGRGTSPLVRGYQPKMGTKNPARLTGSSDFLLQLGSSGHEHFDFRK